MGDEDKKVMKRYWFLVRCECGETLGIEAQGSWMINIIGLMQFRCPCGKIINTAGVWTSNEAKIAQ